MLYFLGETFCWFFVFWYKVVGWKLNRALGFSVGFTIEQAVENLDELQTRRVRYTAHAEEARYRRIRLSQHRLALEHCHISGRTTSNRRLFTTCFRDQIIRSWPPLPQTNGTRLGKVWSTNSPWRQSLCHIHTSAGSTRFEESGCVLMRPDGIIAWKGLVPQTNECSEELQVVLKADNVYRLIKA